MADKEERASLEVIAPSIDEAVAKGLEDLGLGEDEVEIEILDTGSKGVMGLGARQSRVRLTLKSGSEIEDIQSLGFTEGEPTIEERVEEIVNSVEESTDVEKSFVPQDTRAPYTDLEEESQEDIEGTGLEIEGEETAERIARDTVLELLEKMKISAEVDVYYGDPDDERSKAPLNVDISGDDLSILIGRRAETLNAFQYICGLIIGKELGHSVPLVIDVEGYRKRRAQQVRGLAQRMAQQAVKTGRRQMLEPMPAYERRLIHIELRKNSDVVTESIGEEPRRKITIIPVGYESEY